VRYRETHGPFASVDELLEIPGIGNALLERNRERLTVE
jgi:competence protein ComEA